MLYRSQLHFFSPPFPTMMSITLLLSLLLLAPLSSSSSLLEAATRRFLKADQVLPANYKNDLYHCLAFNDKKARNNDDSIDCDLFTYTWNTASLDPAVMPARCVGVVVTEADVQDGNDDDYLEPCVWWHVFYGDLKWSELPSASPSEQPTGTPSSELYSFDIVVLFIVLDLFSILNFLNITPFSQPLFLLSLLLPPLHFHRQLPPPHFHRQLPPPHTLLLPHLSLSILQRRLHLPQNHLLRPQPQNHLLRPHLRLHLHLPKNHLRSLPLPPRSIYSTNLDAS